MILPHIARFQVDATPPIGHPLCGGWIEPVAAVDDPLWFRGIALLERGLPIVLATLDYTGVQNESHRRWTRALSVAARTVDHRVALHCVHQHNAPFVDLLANRLLRESGSKTSIYDDTFLDGLLDRCVQAVREAIDRAVPVRHVSTGAAKVEQVASNRRVIGPDGRILYTRTSAAKDPAARAAPEGTIDRVLRTIAFHDDPERSPLARLYSYTTHPMSYYGDGRVSSDFVGLARQARDDAEPDTLHIYFTGCAGNITAGKYNDGSHENRQVLARRVLDGMLAAERDSESEKRPFDQVHWNFTLFSFRPREDLDSDALRGVAANTAESTANRHRAAMAWSWLSRVRANQPVRLSRVDLPAVRLLFLPGETFVEYQLEAQKIDPNVPLFTVAYGDGGPWYIPLDRSFDEGGYEPSVSWVSRKSEQPYREAIRKLLS
jgi:hypothetical protein